MRRHGLADRQLQYLQMSYGFGKGEGVGCGATQRVSFQIGRPIEGRFRLSVQRHGAFEKVSCKGGHWRNSRARYQKRFWRENPNRCPAPTTASIVEASLVPWSIATLSFNSLNFPETSAATTPNSTNVPRLGRGVDFGAVSEYV